MPRQNTPPADYPQAVLQQIERLAQNIVIARKRRGESQAQWAKKLGISQPTMARIERGDPSVAMASYVMCMWLINPANGLADLIAPQNDHAALEKEVAKVRAKRKPADPDKAASPIPVAHAAIHEPAPEFKKPAQKTDQPTQTPQLSGEFKNTPAAMLAKAASKQPANPLEKAMPPGLKAVLAFHDSPAGQRLKAASNAAEGLSALMRKSAPNKE